MGLTETITKHLQTVASEVVAANDEQFLLRAHARASSKVRQQWLA